MSLKCGVHESGVHESGVHESGVHESGVHESGVQEATSLEFQVRSSKLYLDFRAPEWLEAALVQATATVGTKRSAEDPATSKM